MGTSENQFSPARAAPVAGEAAKNQFLVTKKLTRLSPDGAQRVQDAGRWMRENKKLPPSSMFKTKAEADAFVNERELFYAVMPQRGSWYWPAKSDHYQLHMSTVEKDQNVNQKTMTWLALAVFAATLIWAPWEVTDTLGAEWRLTRKEFAPLWNAPRPQNNLGTSEIRMSVLFVEWITIGVFYVGLSSVYVRKLNTPPQPPRP